MPFNKMVFVYSGILTKGIHTHLNVVLTICTTWHNTEGLCVMVKCFIYVFTIFGRIRREVYPVDFLLVKQLVF
jgi:hypothetical protein